MIPLRRKRIIPPFCKLGFTSLASYDQYSVAMNSSSLSIADFMDHLHRADKSEYHAIMTYLMTEFGTTLPCNRFSIGNCNEYAIADVIRTTPMEVTEKQNAVRIDMGVTGFRDFSIKYSSGGTVILHNSQGSNKDTMMHDTLLVTPTEWWFLSPAEIEKYSSVPISTFLDNRGDSLSLNLNGLLKELRKAEYPHHFEFDISIKRENCKHREISKIVYEYARNELRRLKTK